MERNGELMYEIHHRRHLDSKTDYILIAKRISSLEAAKDYKNCAKVAEYLIECGESFSYEPIS